MGSPLEIAVELELIPRVGCGRRSIDDKIIGLSCCDGESDCRIISCQARIGLASQPRVFQDSYELLSWI